METYHPHKLPPGTKIKGLIFEFLMMFLAITGGFFMENMREEYVERHKEMEYIESMVNDIKQDTISVQEIITTCEKQIKGMDSLKTVLNNPVAKIDYRQMYRLTMKYLNTLISFGPNQITMTQLKNSGGLRLISNKSVTDSIVNYYSTYDSHLEQQKYTMGFLQETLRLEIVAMDFNKLSGANPKFSFDQNKLKEFGNRTLFFQSLLDNEVIWLKKYQKISISLLKYLKKEYKLET
jgi:hypothetical protein